MSLDFEKCFDKIEHKALQGALKYFNFPESFICWCSLFFSDFYVCTQNFGYLSPLFCKTRGLNQGCCYSPFGFLLCGEIMRRKIVQNQDIIGIHMGNNIQCLISQFADDTTLFLKFDQLVLESVIQTLTYIEEHTGPTISYDKTLIY